MHGHCYVLGLHKRNATQRVRFCAQVANHILEGDNSSLCRSVGGDSSGLSIADYHSAKSKLYSRASKRPFGAQSVSSSSYILPAWAHGATKLVALVHAQGPRMSPTLDANTC